MRSHELRPGLLVTATDTGVGKTYITAAIASVLLERGDRVGVLKPVATGAVAGVAPRGEDAAVLGAALGRGVPLERITPMVFEEPLAPTVAARRAGRPLTWPDLWRATLEAAAWWSDPAAGGAEWLLVEGVGGVLCPIAERATVADLAVALDYPVVLVARRGLGTVNHTLLSVEALRGRGVRVAGVVLNEAEPGPDMDDLAVQTNPEELGRWLPAEVPILASVGHAGRLRGSPLCGDLGSIDWTGLAARSRRPIVGP